MLDACEKREVQQNSGERARVKEPTERAPNISVISALRLSGVGATMMIEGAVDTRVWDGYIERFLAPELEPGEIVMLDQVSFHGSLRAIGQIRNTHVKTAEKLGSPAPGFSHFTCYKDAKQREVCLPREKIFHFFSRP